jgi:IS30 family transposase
MTVSIELARGVHGLVASISHECIYQAIYSAGRGLAAGLHVGLHLKRRRRKHRGRTPVVATHSLGSFNLIGLRPEIAAQRIEVGHLEGDLIVGAYNRSAIATMFDRASRYVWLTKLPHAKNADGVLDALVATLRRLPARLRLTLTWDQGSEMARHLELTKRCGIDIYFAEPKAPWQRPTNENGNALVRRYVGKGTDLSVYSTRDLRAIERRINTIPRRSLNWATANDTYTAAVAMTG